MTTNLRFPLKLSKEQKDRIHLDYESVNYYWNYIIYNLQFNLNIVPIYTAGVNSLKGSGVSHKDIEKYVDSLGRVLEGFLGRQETESQYYKKTHGVIERRKAVLLKELRKMIAGNKVNLPKYKEFNSVTRMKDYYDSLLKEIKKTEDTTRIENKQKRSVNYLIRNRALFNKESIGGGAVEIDVFGETELEKITVDMNVIINTKGVKDTVTIENNKGVYELVLFLNKNAQVTPVEPEEELEIDDKEEKGIKYVGVDLGYHEPCVSISTGEDIKSDLVITNEELNSQQKFVEKFNPLLLKIVMNNDVIGIEQFSEKILNENKYLGWMKHVIVSMAQVMKKEIIEIPLEAWTSRRCYYCGDLYNEEYNGMSWEEKSKSENRGWECKTCAEAPRHSRRGRDSNAAYNIRNIARYFYENDIRDVKEYYRKLKEVVNNKAA